MIHAAFEQEGELPACIELHRLFPGITGGAKARKMTRQLQRGRLSTRCRPALGPRDVHDKPAFNITSV